MSYEVVKMNGGGILYSLAYATEVEALAAVNGIITELLIVKAGWIDRSLVDILDVGDSNYTYLFAVGRDTVGIMGNVINDDDVY